MMADTKESDDKVISEIEIDGDFSGELLAAGRDAIVHQTKQYIYGGHSIPQPTMHIMTSVKGGVGKTLICLCVACCYLDHDPNKRVGTGELLAIDSNTMNSDLYRILAESLDRGSPVGQTQWQYVNIMDNMPHIAVTRNEPKSLFKGTSDFWGSINSVISAYSAQYDVIVDTNLHVQNLYAPDKDTKQALLQAVKSRKVYIWIFWNFAAMRDEPKVIRHGMDGLSTITNKKVEFIHVLNPSALIKPGSNIEEEVEAVAKKVNFLDDLDKGKPIFTSAYDEDEEARRMIEELRQKTLAKLPTNIPSLKDPRSVPGLKELMQETCGTKIEFADFQNKVITPVLKDYESESLVKIFARIYEESFRNTGRPANILPVAVYDPSLEGYTESVNIKNLCSGLKELRPNVQQFLLELSALQGK